MSDLISRQAAIDVLSLGKEILSRVLDDIDVVGADREKYSWGLGLIESYINDIEELPSAQLETHDKRTETHACDLISRQWLMECVNEGWIKFDTKKDENRFIHLVRDIAPSAQQDIEEDEDIPMEYFENGGI